MSVLSATVHFRKSYRTLPVTVLYLYFTICFVYRLPFLLFIFLIVYTLIYLYFFRGES